MKLDLTEETNGASTPVKKSWYNYNNLPAMKKSHHLDD